MVAAPKPPGPILIHGGIIYVTPADPTCQPFLIEMSTGHIGLESEDGRVGWYRVRPNGELELARVSMLEPSASKADA